MATLPFAMATIVPTDAGMVYALASAPGSANDVALIDPETRSVQLIAPGLPPLTSFVVGSSRIYLALAAADAGIAAMPLTGGALETVPGSQEATSLLFADDSSLYWVSKAQNQPAELRALPVDGGIPFTLATEGPGVVWRTLVQNSDSVFAAGTDGVERILKSGGQVLLSPETTAPFALRLAADDGPDLFASDDFTEWRIDVPGGTTHSLPGVEPFVEWLAAGGGNAFVSLQLGGNFSTRHHDLLRLDSSGHVDRLASTGPNGWQPALGPRHVYWVADRTLFRVPR